MQKAILQINWTTLQFPSHIVLGISRARRAPLLIQASLTYPNCTVRRPRLTTLVRVLRVVCWENSPLVNIMSGMSHEKITKTEIATCFEVHDYLGILWIVSSIRLCTFIITGDVLCTQLLRSAACRVAPALVDGARKVLQNGDNTLEAMRFKSFQYFHEWTKWMRNPSMVALSLQWQLLTSEHKIKPFLVSNLDANNAGLFVSFSGWACMFL